MLRLSAPLTISSLIVLAATLGAPLAAAQPKEQPKEQTGEQTGVARQATISPEQVKALVQDAVTLISRDGLDKARQVFHQSGAFRHDDIYVNVIDMDGVWRVYPPQPGGEGKSVLGVQDADGKFLVQDIIALAKKNGEGWISYRWLNPETKKIQLKQSFVKRVPGKDLVVYVGIYR